MTNLSEYNLLNKLDNNPYNKTAISDPFLFLCQILSILKGDYILQKKCHKKKINSKSKNRATSNKYFVNKKGDIKTVSEGIIWGSNIEYYYCDGTSSDCASPMQIKKWAKVKSYHYKLCGKWVFCGSDYKLAKDLAKPILARERSIKEEKSKKKLMMRPKWNSSTRPVRTFDGCFPPPPPLIKKRQKKAKNKVV